MLEKKKNCRDPEKSPSRNYPQQVQNDNMSIYDVQNPNKFDFGDLFFTCKSWTFSRRAEWIAQRKRRETDDLLYIGQHIFKKRKCNVANSLVYDKRTYDTVAQL